MLSVLGVLGVLSPKKAVSAAQTRFRLRCEAVEVTHVAKVHNPSAEVGSNFSATPVALVFHEFLIVVRIGLCSREKYEKSSMGMVSLGQREANT